MTSIFCTSLSLTQLPSDLIANHSGVRWHRRGASSRLAHCPVSLMLDLSSGHQAAAEILISARVPLSSATCQGGKSQTKELRLSRVGGAGRDLSLVTWWLSGSDVAASPPPEPVC